MNWLFLFVPLSIILQQISSAPSALVFLIAGLAMVPIARTLVRSTEQLAHHTGEALGGLLNATFGNAPELIILTVALQAGYFDMVRSSIMGAIIANLLLAQGLSFFLGGLRYHDQSYNPNATRMYSSIMMVAVLSLAIPSTFERAVQAHDSSVESQTLNLIIAITLLVAYALYLLFMLKTHPTFFAPERAEHGNDASPNQWSVPRALFVLTASSVLAAFVSEILVGAAEGAGKSLGMSEVFMGVICLSIVGGAAEIASAVAMARKDRMDLSIGISLGSSIQIALFVAPMLVLASYVIAPTPLTLVFRPQALLFLLLVVLIGGMVAGDGRSNWYKGAQLIIVYFMLGALLYLIPSADL